MGGFRGLTARASRRLGNPSFKSVSEVSVCIKPDFDRPLRNVGGFPGASFWGRRGVVQSPIGYLPLFPVIPITGNSDLLHFNDLRKPAREPGPIISLMNAARTADRGPGKTDREPGPGGSIRSRLLLGDSRPGDRGLVYSGQVLVKSWSSPGQKKGPLMAGPVVVVWWLTHREN